MPGRPKVGGSVVEAFGKDYHIDVVLAVSFPGSLQIPVKRCACGRWAYTQHRHIPVERCYLVQYPAVAADKFLAGRIWRKRKIMFLRDRSKYIEC